MGAFFHSAFQKYVDFEMLANAGFCALLTGVESVSEENLKYFVAKNNSIKDLFALGVKSKKAGIFVSQSFIAPEAEATFEPFDRYLSEYPFDSDNSSITLFFPLVYPGTGWWKNPAQYGIEITNRNHYLRGLLFGDDPKHHPVSYSIQIKGRPFSDLSLEFVETKRRVLSKGINLNITDEIALLAIASGQNPHKFHIRQQSAIRRYDATDIRTLFSITNPRQAIVGAEIALILFLVLFGFKFFFDNLFEHLLLTIYRTSFGELDLASISIYATIGIIASLPLASITNRTYSFMGGKKWFILTLLLALTGFVYTLPINNFIKIMFVSFLLNEFGALSLAVVRDAQLDAQKYNPTSQVVSLSLIVGCITSVIGIAAFSKISDLYGFAVSFFVMAGVFLFLITSVSMASRSARYHLALFLIFTGIGFVKQATGAEIYTSAMSDKPRFIQGLESKVNSEDESFLNYNTMCALVRRDVNQGLVPELAESWEIKSNSTELVLKLRKNIHDSDGTKIDASYVKASLEEQLRQSLSHKGDLRGFKFIKGIDECTSSRCNLIGVSANESILKITFSKPCPDFLGLLEESFFVQKIKKQGAREIPVSCGPYKIVENNADNMLLARNLRGMRVSPQGPELFRIRILAPEKAYTEFCKGTINDLLFFMPSKEDLFARGCKPEQIQYIEVYSPGFWYATLAPHKEINRRKETEALLKHFEAEKFRHNWGLDAVKQEHLLPRDFGSPSIVQEKSIVTNPSPLKIARHIGKSPLITRFIKGMPNESQLVTAIQYWTKKSNVRMNIIATPFSEFMTDLNNGNSDVYVYGEVAMSANPLQFISSFYEQALDHATIAWQSELQKSWSKYLASRERQDLMHLDQQIQKTGLFFPLFALKRPLVMNRATKLERYGDFGLFNLEIRSFGNTHD